MVISDRDEIRHLLTVYNNCGDRGAIDEMVSVFTPDCILEIPDRRFEGRDDAAAFFKSVATQKDGDVDLRGARHNLTTSRIDFDSDTTASGWTYFFVTRRGQTIEEGVYIDKYRKTADGWRISQRRVKIIFSEFLPDL